MITIRREFNTIRIWTKTNRGQLPLEQYPPRYLRRRCDWQNRL